MDAGRGFCELEMQMYDQVGPRVLFQEGLQGRRLIGW